VSTAVASTLAAVVNANASTVGTRFEPGQELAGTGATRTFGGREGEERGWLGEEGGKDEGGEVVGDLFQRHGWNTVNSGFSLLLGDSGDPKADSSAAAASVRVDSGPESGGGFMTDLEPPDWLPNPDLISYATVIAALGRSRNVMAARRAVALYWDMRRTHNIAPDERLVSTIFSVIANSALDGGGSSRRQQGQPGGDGGAVSAAARALGSVSADLCRPPAATTVTATTAAIRDEERGGRVRRGGLGWSKELVGFLRSPAEEALQATTSEMWRTRTAQNYDGDDVDGELFLSGGAFDDDDDDDEQGMMLGGDVATEDALFQKHGWNEVDSGFRFFLP